MKQKNATYFYMLCTSLLTLFPFILNDSFVYFERFFRSL